jgi:uncharacterized membrane protein YfcA
MDTVGALELSIFLIGSFAAAFVTALAGFAFGLIAAAIWLYALAPQQTTTLIVAYGLLVQGYAVWKLRHTINASRLVPLVVGSAVVFRSAFFCCGGCRPAIFARQLARC